MTRRIASLLVSMIVASRVGAEVTTWTIDQAHSSVAFSVRHMMVSTVRGAFTKFSGAVATTGGDPAAAKVDVTIDAASIDTREANRDNHLRSTDFFDVPKFPTITFVSKSVEKTAGGLKVTGDLTLHGVTREVELEVTDLTEPIRDPWGNLRVGAHATTTVDRRDFGMTWNKALETGGVVVGVGVTITIDLELVTKAPAAAK
jgi:polyisoprenoid-binding protein YceI